MENTAASAVIEQISTEIFMEKISRESRPVWIGFDRDLNELEEEDE